MKSRRSFLALLGAFICAPAAIIKAAKRPAPQRDFDSLPSPWNPWKSFDRTYAEVQARRVARNAANVQAMSEAPQIHVYNFTDLESLLRHVRSTKGQKITIKIDPS